MKMTSLRSISLVILLAAFHAGANAQKLPDFTDLVKQVGPAVVSVEATRTAESQGESPHGAMPEDVPPEMREFFRRFFGDPDQQPEPRDRTAAGSGFIISDDGYILTNNHVVADADEVVVGLSDQREFKAEVVGTDEATDLALLKIDGDNLTAANLGDSEELETGEWVLAIGSPFGLDHTVTAGIVSAKSRSIGGQSQQYIPFIQTDVAINRGNSGGPLINMDGEVVGINSQIFSATGGYMGLSFSTPINVAQHVVSQLKEDGAVSRGWLGVQIQQVSRDLAEVLEMDRTYGALVSDVVPDSPAEKAGIEPRDVIIRFNGKRIDEWQNLPPLVGLVSPGSTVPVEVVRDGERRTLDVTIGELPDDGTEATESADPDTPTASPLGVTVENLTEEQREQLDIERGVVVSRVTSREARRAGVQPGDVIVSVDNKPVSDRDEFQQIVGELEPGVPVAVLVRRGEGSIFVALTPESPEE